MDSSVEVRDTSSSQLQHQRNDNDDKKIKPQWSSDVPHELVAKFASALGIIDLISFRSVCKDWNSASNTASVSAEIESSTGKQPYFLAYNQTSDPNSILLSPSQRCYKLNIPVLKDATCIASKDGWLLVLKNDSSIFFFCPFSHAKIDLPKLPNTNEFSYQLGAFTSPPTSEECKVGVICQNEKSLQDLVLYFLCRGDTAWKCETYKKPDSSQKIVMAATYNGNFMFFDDTKYSHKFCERKMKWTTFRLVAGREGSGLKTLPFSWSRKLMDENIMSKLKEGLEIGEEDNVNTAICGTGFAAENGGGKMTYTESNNIGMKASESNLVKGVWIQPRFHTLANSFTW